MWCPDKRNHSIHGMSNKTLPLVHPYLSTPQLRGEVIGIMECFRIEKDMQIMYHFEWTALVHSALFFHSEYFTPLSKTSGK